MALSFPASPTIGTTYTSGSRTWRWDGSRWQVDLGARTPSAHASTHATGGSDPITPASIGAATSAQGAKADSALQSGAAISAISGLQTALDGKQASGSYATAAQGAKADLALSLSSYLASIGQTSNIIETFSRNTGIGATALGSQNAYFTFFVPVVNVTISRLICNITAVGTSSFFKMGVYSFNETTGVCTFLAATANSPTSTSVVQLVDLPLSPATSITLQAGVKYALAILSVNSSAPSASSVQIGAAISALSPVQARIASGQNDLVATITPSNTSGAKFYIRGTV